MATVNISTTVPFTFSVRLGIVFIVQSASLSLLAVTACLSYIAYSAIRINRGATRNWSTSSHIHWYFLNLLLSDLVQAIGGVLSVRWIMKAAVEEGPLCIAQGIFKQMGDVGVACTSMVIALHTFSVLVFHWSPHPATGILVVATIWVFIALNVGISTATHKGKIYYGNTQYWCWITSKYPIQRIMLEYLWLWLACFVNIVVYVCLALVVKGFLVVKNGRLSIAARKDRRYSRLVASRGATGGKETGNIALQMLYYPAVYIITVLPVALARWLAFTGHTVPFPATAFASILFSSSGLLNVLLFKFTRPKLLPARENTAITSKQSFNTTSIYNSPSRVNQAHFSGQFDRTPTAPHENWIQRQSFLPTAAVLSPPPHLYPVMVFKRPDAVV